ncbi:transposase, Ptta/En/Spm, transposase, Tnp1/En/Spm-like protein [Tanacetum coccineum]|uniref:Transposase, Ptta/En/Spm, transposase, Tnp1/En/Spm-like protein n=1 Tax=Tanacetum coccineum TaxID=301880 RepID=A0ABQ5CRD7_9ASTR
MAAHGGRNNIVSRRVIDDPIDISGERSPPKTSMNLISQLNALIAELEASGDYEEVFDLVMELRDDRRDEQDKVADFNRLIAVAEEKIHGKEIDLEMLEAEGNDVAVGCAIGLCTEEYFDEGDEEDENNHSNGNVVKRGITRALFLSFLRDMIHEHIGLKILSWKKVDSEARDKLWDEITRYFDVDLTVKKMVMNRLGQLLKNFRRKLRQTYILPNQNTLSKLNEVPAKYSAILKAEEWVNFVKYTATEEYKMKSTAAKMARSKSVYQHTMGRDQKKEIEPDEEPPRGTLWLKGRVNKDEEYPDDEIRSVGDKLKETEDKIKEGTLKVDHGTDAMTFVLASDERILLLQSQLDNERRERQEKELLIQNLSNKMSQTEGMVSPVDINPINSSAYEEGGTTVVGCENDASIQKSNGLATLEKEMETRVSNKTSPCETVKSVGSKKMTRSIRKDSSRQDSQSQENVSPLLVLPQAIKCKLWHLKKSTIIALGTVYKTDGKQMLHNKELPKDCYKVSIDTSLVDAACIPDVGNNGFKTVKDAVGGFFAWPKDQVVFDPKATPPSTIQMNVENKTAPKLQTKRKNVYVSSDAMQRQAKKKMYIEIDIHFVRDLVAASQVRVLHVPSRYQYADIFTNSLPSVLFEEFYTSLSVRCPLAQTSDEC